MYWFLNRLTYGCLNGLLVWTDAPADAVLNECLIVLHINLMLEQMGCPVITPDPFSLLMRQRGHRMSHASCTRMVLDWPHREEALCLWAPCPLGAFLHAEALRAAVFCISCALPALRQNPSRHLKWKAAALFRLSEIIIITIALRSRRVIQTYMTVGICSFVHPAAFIGCLLFAKIWWCGVRWLILTTPSSRSQYSRGHRHRSN